MFTTISDPLDQSCPVELSTMVAFMSLRCGQHSSGCLPICRHYHRSNRYYDFESFKNAIDKLYQLLPMESQLFETELTIEIEEK